jgi:hypothetical protein
MNFSGDRLRAGCWQVLALMLALLQVGSAVAQAGTPVPLSVAAQKVKADVGRIPIDGKLTVRLIRGMELHGRLTAVDTDSFSIEEVDLGRTFTLKYEEVRKVSQDYGGKGINGHRVDPKKNLIASIVVLGALLGLILFTAHETGKS